MGHASEKGQTAKLVARLRTRETKRCPEQRLREQNEGKAEVQEITKKRLISLDYSLMLSIKMVQRKLNWYSRCKIPK